MPVLEKPFVLSQSRGEDRLLLDATIGDLLCRNAARFGDRPAAVSCHQNQRMTWSELHQTATRFAHGLWSLGIRKGDRIGIWSTNCIEWIVIHMGAALAGVALVNVNPAYRVHELRYTLERSRMKAIFLWHKDRHADYHDLLDQARAGHTLALEHAIFLDSPDWVTLLSQKGELPEHVDADDVANIQYTSGTTGLPKGVMLTHRNIVNNGQYLAQGFHYTEQDRVVVPVPLFHCFGCVIGTMSVLNSSACIVLPNWTFDARAVLQAIHNERGTSVYGVPAMYVAEFALPDFAQYDLTSLRTGMMSGAPCPIELMKRVLNEMHIGELVIAYGQTETSPVVTMSDASDEIEVRVNTVGRAMPQTEMCVMSVATGEVLPVGEQGEICVRGYALMKGYDGDVEATAKVIDAEGWLHTGDLGLMREDGCFRITGRSRDVIIRGGENIYPREVEEFLYTNPKVAEVQVVGLPHERLGETVCAWIRLAPGAESTVEEIKGFCKEQIAYYKVPEHIRFVTQFPATLSGKIQKYKIREFEVEALGLQRAAEMKTA